MVLLIEKIVARRNLCFLILFTAFEVRDDLIRRVVLICGLV